MIGAIVAQFAAWGLPEPIRRAAAWATVVAAIIALLWAAKAIYDASVIEDHETERAVESMEAHNVSAEQRAIDAVVNMTNDRLRSEAIEMVEASEAAKPPAERATLPPTTKALNCARLRQAYSKAELAKILEFKEHCS